MISILTDFGKRLPKLVVDNSPVILTAIGATGALTTAYLTGRATFKAAEILQAEYPNYYNHVQIRERARCVWRCYIPPAISATLTVAAIITANRIGTRRAAALATAFATAERAFEEYRAKVVEKLGDKKEELVRAEVAQARVDKHPPGDREIIVTGNGSVLCMDAFSGRYFLCDMETLKKAENEINYRVLHDMYASLTDFYELVGLSRTSVSDEVGWNADKMLELKFSGTITEAGGKPCIYVEFTVNPIRGYNRLM